MLSLLLALLSAITVPPKPAKYVTDNAHVLDAARASALNEKLAQFERDTSNQILVYIDRKLPPNTTIEQFGNEAMHQWGVGQKGKDNGAVLFLFIDDRKMRIEVGYGLEPVLTDAKSREITSTIIKPRLKASDYNGAAELGADAMLVAARGEELKGTGQTVRERRRPVSAAQGRSWFGEFAGMLALFVVLPIVIVVLVIIFLARGRRGTSGWSRTTYVSNSSDSSSSSSWSSFSSSDSGSSSDSSSGFDGGGGDSGGGGSSDSW